jgi:hypothetical protein
MAMSCPSLHQQIVARAAKLLDALRKMVRGGQRAPEGENLVQRGIHGGGQVREHGQQRLDLGGKDAVWPSCGCRRAARIAQPIAGQKERLVAHVPDGDGKLAV